MSPEGRALLQSLKAKAKTAGKRTGATHYLDVNPKDRTIRVKQARLSSSMYARRRVRSAVKLTATNYRKMFAARPLKKFVEYCYGVLQGVEQSTVYPRDTDVTSSHPTFQDAVVRNAGGRGEEIGFHPATSLSLTSGAWDRLQEWAALHAIGVGKAIGDILDITEKTTLQPKHVYAFVKRERPADLFMQRHIVDSIMTDQEQLSLARSLYKPHHAKSGHSRHKHTHTHTPTHSGMEAEAEAEAEAEVGVAVTVVADDDDEAQ